MILPLIILYVVTLVYLAITERFRNFASLIGLQGWLLFAVALVRLHAINPAELAPIASIYLAVWVAIGGRGRLYGAVIGAAMSVPVGQSREQPLHDRHRSSASCTSADRQPSVTSVPLTTPIMIPARSPAMTPSVRLWCSVT